MTGAGERGAMRKLEARAAVVAALLLAVPASAGAETLAFTGARLIPIAGPEIDRGTLVVADGRVVAVGRDGEVAIPAGAAVRDLGGRVVLPGFVDTHSHLGRGSGADRSSLALRCSTARASGRLRHERRAVDVATPSRRGTFTA